MPPLGDVALIFGAGGHARVIASIVAERHASLRFVSLSAEGDNLSEQEFFENQRYWEASLYLGIGDNARRRDLFERLTNLGLSPATCIAKSAHVAPDARIGAGCFVGPCAVLNAAASIGDNVIVNTLSSVDHDCKVGDHSQVTAGVILGGTTTVGQDCFLGIKSATLPSVSIGDGVLVMAGSLVTRDVPSRVVVGGSPAQLVRRI